MRSSALHPFLDFPALLATFARLGLLTLTVLAGPAAAQIMGGPKPPNVEWNVRLGAELPREARFTDHARRELALADCFAARPVVLALVYYECPMLCGLVLEGLVKALRAVDFTTGQDFDVLVVSIDPGETPELAAGKRASALAAYGLEPDDAAGIALLTPSGVVSRVLFGVEFAPRDLRLSLVEASQGSIGTPLDQVLLRCFHYDPTRGKYGFAILAAVRLAGLATLALLVLFVVRWLVRERRAGRAVLGEA